MRLRRDGDTVIGEWRGVAPAWHELGRATLPGAPADCQIGAAVCSHDPELYTSTWYTDLVGGETPEPNFAYGGTLLKEPAARPALDPGAWHPWGAAMHRDGAAWIYNHGLGGDAGLWQDVPATAGTVYRAALDVNRSAGAEGLPERLELTLESTLDGTQVALEHRSASPGDLLADALNRLTARAAAATDTLRVVVRFVPAKGARSGTLRVEKTVVSAEQ
jgi:hypothetical protein